jgi:hypothetical protein
MEEIKIQKGKNRRDKMCFCGCLKTQYDDEEIHGEYSPHMGFQ